MDGLSVPPLFTGTLRAYGESVEIKPILAVHPQKSYRYSTYVRIAYGVGSPHDILLIADGGSPPPDALLVPK